jgi:hypothetical protein
MKCKRNTGGVYMGYRRDQSNIGWHSFSVTAVILLFSLAILFSGCGGGGGGHPASSFSLSGIMTGDIQQGVTITLSGTGSSSTTTASSGNYTFEGIANGSYTVIPTITGYTFTPTNQTIMIAGTNASAINFTSTKNTGSLSSISGTVMSSSGNAIHGVTMTLSGSNSGTVSTDVNGNYTLSGLATGSYIITPVRSGYTFSPSSSAKDIDGENIPGVNFTATANLTPTYTITGTITSSGTGLAGVTITLSGSNGIVKASTDAGGRYSFTDLTGSYTIEPSKSDYIFSPEIRSETIKGSDINGVNFDATSQTFSISGKVSGIVSEGVTITLNGPGSGNTIGPVLGSTSTDASGNYSFENLSNGSYTLTLSLSGYTFNPPSLVVGISDENATAINFTSIK